MTDQNISSEAQGSIAVSDNQNALTLSDCISTLALHFKIAFESDTHSTNVTATTLMSKLNTLKQALTNESKTNPEDAKRIEKATIQLILAIIDKTNKTKTSKKTKEALTDLFPQYINECKGSSLFTKLAAIITAIAVASICIAGIIAFAMAPVAAPIIIPAVGGLVMGVAAGGTMAILLNNHFNFFKSSAKKESYDNMMVAVNDLAPSNFK